VEKILNSNTYQLIKLYWEVKKMNGVVHFEVPANDIERAKKFYQIFDWTYTDMQDMNYVIAKTVECDENNMPKELGKINGGFYKRSDGGSPNPVIVIDVPNLDEYLEKVKEAGGSIFIEKRKVGEMGFYAQVKDTEGNIVGLWEMIKKKS
jgi:uncharacterized protein